ncbi:hypothetical protein ACQP25_44820 (plasmid) [Microtetraspora malaysiensis]|uniref:hypothetical protein n=1 Tax=Microtetraspora malaysiensis TaxID=161358 RepID=UPI003D8D5BFF
MALHPGHQRRPASEEGTVLLQGRVPKSVRDRAKRGAAARGISVALYLELLVEADEVAETYTAPEPLQQLDLAM